jgi:hypothetical protein
VCSPFIYPQTRLSRPPSCVRSPPRRLLHCAVRGAECTRATRVNGAAGHTGFTGTSMWLDPRSKRFVVRPSLVTFCSAR